MLPLLCDLVIHGHGYTALPSCGVIPLIRSKLLSGSPLSGLRITWTIARPANRSLTIAGRKLADVVVMIARKMVASGSWALAEFIAKQNPDRGDFQKRQVVASGKKAQSASRERKDIA
jgi:hypothetical protein